MAYLWPVGFRLKKLEEGTAGVRALAYNGGLKLDSIQICKLEFLAGDLWWAKLGFNTHTQTRFFGQGIEMDPTNVPECMEA